VLIAHAVLALLLALAGVTALTTGLRLHERGTPTWALFVILFLATWAGGLWMAPFGPAFRNVYWVPFTLIAVLVAILLAAVLPPEPHSNAEAVEREHEIQAGLGIFFWVLVLALAAAVVARYLR
jgi:hypothetical protein